MYNATFFPFCQQLGVLLSVTLPKRLFNETYIHSRDLAYSFHFLHFHENRMTLITGLRIRKCITFALFILIPWPLKVKMHSLSDVHTRTQMIYITNKQTRMVEKYVQSDSVPILRVFPQWDRLWRLFPWEMCHHL